MEEVNITEHEARFYLDLFARCDIEKSGKVPVLKATEMFRSSEIDDEILKHIMSLAGIPQTALHMSKVQFYSCLKLIAANQTSVPLRKELIASTIQLPLPRFNWNGSTPPVNGSITPDDMLRYRTTTNDSPNLIELARAETQSDVANSDITSTDSEVEHNDNDKKSHKRRNGSPEAWSTASDSPTPTNSVAERPWAQNSLWQGLVCEEQRQLLGTEEELSDRHSSEEDNDVDLETVYQMMPEQKEYYINQFKKIQSDLNGLLSGPAAKVFFEKSRIPVEELRHIWQLCDVTKDGALSLSEFAAAMHLVVLRRNNIPLPPILPECLIPGKNKFDIKQPAEGDLLHLDDDKTDNSIVDTISSTSTSSSTSKVKSANVPPPTAARKSNLTKNSKIQNNIDGDETSPSDVPTSAAVKSKPIPLTTSWTKFPDSPTSNVSSPGAKPVNFDIEMQYQRIVSDPLILHPVPLRITPVGAENSDDDLQTARISYHQHQRKSDNLQMDGGIITIRDSESSSSPKQSSSQNSNDLRAIQRPQPKKYKIHTKNNIGALPPPPQRECNPINNDAIDGVTNVNNKSEAPPTPPPRQQRHVRSNSLDLNKLKLSGPDPPEVPPRISPQMIAQASLDAQLEAGNSSFADFTQFPESVIEASQNHQPNSIEPMDSSQPIQKTSIPSFQSSNRSSAFEVYRKPTPRESTSSPDTSIPNKLNERIPNTAAAEMLRSSLYKNENKNLNDVMRHLKEQNLLLLTICNDLSEELYTVQQKKTEVRAKLDCDGQSGVNNSVNSKELNNQSTV